MKSDAILIFSPLFKSIRFIKGRNSREIIRFPKRIVTVFPKRNYTVSRVVSGVETVREKSVTEVESVDLMRRVESIRIINEREIRREITR